MTDVKIWADSVICDAAQENQRESYALAACMVMIFARGGYWRTKHEDGTVTEHENPAARQSAMDIIDELRRRQESAKSGRNNEA